MRSQAAGATIGTTVSSSGTVNRERVARTLTFWLRPGFVLRVLNRFQKVAGFDRSIALASAALTTMIPLVILGSAAASELGGKGTADRIIDRYRLSEGGAEAVKVIFSPPAGMSTTVGLAGVLFLMVAVLSFSRAVQRLFEQTWDLAPLSVRNTLNGLRWVVGLGAYLVVSGLLHAKLGRSRLELSAALIAAPLSAVFLVWSARVLTARRTPRQDLIPFGVIGAALLALWSVGASLYVPHLFNTYTSRYGVLGALFGMIWAIFCALVIVVGAAAAGRRL
jgi:uncharacterized BrkB/YihY/UPF0761 family membrane protein